MANKNRVSSRNNRGSNQVRLEGEQTMSEQLQSENEQTSIEAEKFKFMKRQGKNKPNKKSQSRPRKNQLQLR